MRIVAPTWSSSTSAAAVTIFPVSQGPKAMSVRRCIAWGRGPTLPATSRTRRTTWLTDRGSAAGVARQRHAENEYPAEGRARHRGVSLYAEVAIMTLTQRPTNWFRGAPWLAVTIVIVAIMGLALAGGGAWLAALGG